MTEGKTSKFDIRNLSRESLAEKMENLELPRFRGDQIWQWLWQKGVTSFDEMTNLSLDLREKLGAAFVIHSIVLDLAQRSADGTIKNRFRLHDGFHIESVIIPVFSENRFTVCVSSQVGCSLSCSFCATGKMKRERNLTAGEIYDQVFLANKQCLAEYGHPLTNIVYMGMGEPLLAYNPVLASIDRITSTDGLNMSPKRITVSTAGIVKMIKKLADDRVRFNLALSLHAADDEKRNEIMPINEQNDLKSLKEALRYFQKLTSNRVTLEYIALQNFNDGLNDADNLARFCRGMSWRINIIEYNPVEGFAIVGSERKRLERFARRLSDQGVLVTVRRSRGRDIDAACGQLANKDVV